MILGKGPEHATLLSKAEQLGIGRDVAFPGWVANPFAYMSHASVFVLSSSWEGLGNVLIEAMACGCPVVATDCPSGPREILDNGSHGTLVPVNDISALAEAITDTLWAPRRAESLRRRADDFSTVNAMDAYQQLIDTLAGRGAGNHSRLITHDT